MFADTRAIQTANTRSNSNNSKSSPEQSIPTTSSSPIPTSSTQSSTLSSQPAYETPVPPPPPPPFNPLVARQPQGTVFKRFKSKLVKRKEKVGTTIPVITADGADGSVPAVPGSAGGGSSSSSSSNDITHEDKGQSGQDGIAVVSSGIALGEVVGRGECGLASCERQNQRQEDVPPSLNSKPLMASAGSESDSESISPTSKKLAQRIQTFLPSSCNNPSQFFPFSLAGFSGTPLPTRLGEGENSQLANVNDVGSSSSTQQQPNESHSKLVSESIFRLNLLDAKFMDFLTSPLPLLPHSHSRPGASGGAKDVGRDGASDSDGDGDKLRVILDKWTRFVIRKRSGKDKESGELHRDSGDVAGDDADESGSGSESDGSDSSSVVISCSLEPTDETEVEVARSEVISVDIDTRPSDAPPPFFSQEQGEDSDKPNFWSLFPKKRKTTTSETGELNSSSPPRRLKEIRIWYPSRTKVSLEATWWGYRIYLPPPVMQILSDKSLEAAKRAAMITAALTWLVSHVPIQLLPPQFKPLTVLLKEIVPLVGYVGGFIAWSWNTVKGFDKGDGVILSATWLFPIALIPGTWLYTESSCEVPLENVGTRDGGSPPPPPPKDTPTSSRTPKESAGRP